VAAFRFLVALVSNIKSPDFLFKFLFVFELAKQLWSRHLLAFEAEDSWAACSRMRLDFVCMAV